MSDNNQGRQAGRRGGSFKFVVELGDENCRTITINTLKLRLRGGFSFHTLSKREAGPRDVGSVMVQMPEIPGIRLAVDTEKSICVQFDPLEDDEPTLNRINAVRRAATPLRGAPVTFVPRVTHKLDKDQLKTLCDELYKKVHDEGAAKLTDGEMPTVEQIEQMPGGILNDPWNSNIRKPRYKADVEAYERELERQ